MKLCGCREKCFINGEQKWGHCGDELCKHISEEHVVDENGDEQVFGLCLLTKERTEVYINEEEYKKAKEKQA